MAQFTEEELRGFITAAEARENSSLPQLKKVFECIDKSIKEGD